MLDQLNDKNNISMRLEYIDQSRGMAIIAVVLGHVISQYFSKQGNTSLNIIDEIIVLFNMPLFMIISGYCGISSMEKISHLRDWLIYVWHIWQRILLPTVAIGHTPASTAPTGAPPP